MPLPATSLPPVTGIACVLTMPLPAWMLFPDSTRGCWMDCYRDPDKVRILNTFLWLLSCADTANVTVYIETMPDFELVKEGVVTITRFYRVFVPLTEMDARNMSTHMAMKLTTVAEEPTANGRPNKRARLSRETDAIDLQENRSRMNNLVLDHNKIDSEAALLQYIATSRGGASNAQFSSIDFSAPPNTGFLDGNGALDSSDDDESADESDDIVTDAFDSFYANLAPNNILRLFDITDGFSRGTARFEGIAAEQLDLANYWHNHVFSFPPICSELGLVVVIRSGWPGMEDNVNNLVYNYALPAASLRMTTEELHRKMESMHAINGTFMPAHYRDLPFEELKKIWMTQGAEHAPHGHGIGHDPSYYTPIEMLSANDTRDPDLQVTKSDQILGEMYPGLDRLSGGISHEYHRMCKALAQGRITASQMSTWRADVIRRMDQLFSGDPKDGFVEVYFNVSRESTTLLRAFNRAQPDVVTREAQRLLRLNLPGMNAGNSLQCVMATLLQGPLHLTQAQASVASFIWHGTLTALMPVTNCPQPVVCLFGPPDSGKSAIMELVVNVLILSAACVCRDTHSKRAMTANGQVGVQLQDELKIGVENADSLGTDWLTSWSRGYHVHERLQLATRPGEITHNEVTKSDRRTMQVTATNSCPVDNFKSRMISIYCSGAQNSGRTRQELSTIPDDTQDYCTAVKVFQYIWAVHSEIYKIQQCLHFKTVTVMSAIWFGLAKKTLGSSYAPAPRQLISVTRMARGYMNARLVAEYDRLPDATKPPSIVDYAMANPLLLMQDLMSAYVGLEKNTDNDHEKAVVVGTLKESILMLPGGMLDLQLHGSDHYVTSKKTIEELTSATSELKAATGIVADIVRQLSRPQGSSNVAEVTIVNKRGEHQGHMAIHKNLIGGTDAASMTRAQKVLMDFFANEVIAEVTNAQQLRGWYVDMDEEWIVFPRQVKEVLLNRHTQSANRFDDSAILRRAQLSAEATTRAFCIWEAAGVMQFRNRDEQPDILNTEGITIVDSERMGATRVGRGGPCDHNSLFPDYNITHDDDMTPEWKADQMAAVGIITEPPARPWKIPVRLVNVIRMKTEILLPYINHALKKQYGLALPAVQPPSREGRQAAICRLWDTVMAVSGEIMPGGVVNMGISHRSTQPYETHVIRKLNAPTVTMLNPRRRSAETLVVTAIDTDSVIDDLLNPAQALLTFPTDAQAPLYKTLQAKAAAANGM